MNPGTSALIIGGLLAILGVCAFMPFGLWVSARVSGVKISLAKLAALRLQKVSPLAIVSAMILAHKAGIAIDCDSLVVHHKKGGHADRVVYVLILAKKAGMSLAWQEVAAADLTGRNILIEIQERIKNNHKVQTNN